MEEKLEAKYRALIGEYSYALKWTRDKLKEAEEENRKLKLIIIKMSENDEWKEEERPYDFDS